MPLLRYIGRRILFVVPQLFGIILVSFFLVKLIPGDPAVMRAELRREIAAEPHVLFVAYASIATAAILIVLNTVAPPGGESKRSGTRAVSPNATPPFSPVSARVGNRRRPSPVTGLRVGTP